jgi:ferredoxin
MSTTIFYFTGTGNCLKVARDLAAELGDAEVISIAKAINKEIDLLTERIGIVYPVYMFGMPLIVKEFIGKLKSGKDKYIFAVATYGGMAGSALGQTARQLTSQGMQLSAGFSVKMPGNYTPLYEAIPLEKQNKLFAEERQRIKAIAETVKEKRQVKIENGPFLLNLFFSGLLYNLFSPKIPLMDRDFWADEKCTSCGTCAKVCPVNNIEIINGRPVWLHKCQQCMACLHWCPVEAIQYGKKTSGRRRYRHPEVKVEDMF